VRGLWKLQPKGVSEEAGNALCVLASGSSDSMIKKRPTFATGHSLAGLPAVSKVLHTDERCELYA
jgi:hypothetical protein